MFKFEIGKYYKKDNKVVRIMGSGLSAYKGLVLIGEHREGVELFAYNESAAIGWEETTKEEFYKNMF